MPNRVSHLREFGKFRLDAEKRVLWCGDRPVNLPLKEIELLSVLVRKGGQVVTKDELLSEVWNDSFVEESNLSRHVYTLRKTFKDLGEERELIQTVPRRGYRFAGVVSGVESTQDVVFERRTSTRTLIQEFQEENGFRSESLAGGPNNKFSWKLGARLFRRRITYLLIAPVLLASLVVAFSGWVGQNPSAESSGFQIRSIAVLPLKSFAQEDDELRLRIADALITKFGNLPNISVRPTNSVVRFAKIDTDAITAGKLLSVDAVLDGRVQTEGNRLRVTLQLVSVRTGKQIWSEQLDGQTNEILDLQDRIAAAILPKLSLTDEQMARLASANPTTNAEAYESYLKGRYLWNKRRGPELKEAAGYFERAIALDPNFALAYAGLADAFSQLANHNLLPRFEGYSKAKTTAQRALAINPNLSEAYSALGWVLYKHEWDWTKAENAFAKAIELNPNNAEAHHWRGLNFLTVGKNREYFEEMEKARSLAPLTKPVAQNYYRVVLMQAGCGKASEYVEEFISLHQLPDMERAEFSGWHLTNCGEPYQAAASFETVPMEKLSSKSKAMLGAAYAKMGKRREALEILKRLDQTTTTTKFYVMPYVQVALGQSEAAFANLERAFSVRDDRLTNLRYDDLLAPLRPDPRFSDLLKKMNIPGN